MNRYNPEFVCFPGVTDRTPGKHTNSDLENIRKTRNFYEFRVFQSGWKPLLILVPFSFSRYCETSWRVLKSCMSVCLCATARRRDLFQKFTERLWPTELRYNCRGKMPAEEAERKVVPGSVHVSPPCTTYSAAHRTVVEYQSRGSFHIHSLQFVPFAQFPGSRTSS
jgi:hypothetical protein